MQLIIIWALGFLIMFLLIRALVPGGSEKAVDRLLKREISSRKKKLEDRNQNLIKTNQEIKSLGIFLEKKFGSKTQQTTNTETRKLLIEAGFRETYNVYLYSLSQLVGAALGVMVAFTYMTFYPSEGTMSFVYPILGLAIGAYIPILYVKNRRNARVSEIKNILPDALDMIALCNEASMSIDAALRKIAKEMERKYPIISQEFAIIGIELSLLDSRAKAFDGFYKRIPIDEVRSFVSGINQSERTGTPVSRSMRLLASEMRKDRIAKIQGRLEALSSKLVLPLALFFFVPVILLMVLPIFTKADFSAF